MPWPAKFVGAVFTELAVTVADTGSPETNGTNLQTAINTAAIGDTIVVKAGASYTTTSAGGFTFPAKGAGWDNRRVTICSSRVPGLPSSTRVTPAQDSFMATLSTSAKGPTLNFANARGYTLQGLNITYTAACQTGASVAQIVDLTNADADITFDRCWVHPLESATDTAFRAAERGLAGLTTVKNFQLTNSYINGFVGWGYNHTRNWMAALESVGGTHVRVKNTFLQGLRTWYMGAQGSNTYPADVVIQHNTFDVPAGWASLTDGSSGTPTMPTDYRQLILYSGDTILIVGNQFTGFTPGSWGIFYYQADTAAAFRFIQFLSNFIDGSSAALSQIAIYHTTYAGHDLAFVNNLVRGANDPINGNRWSFEFGGPTGDIASGVVLAAGQGINALHNTMRGITSALYSPDGVHPSAYCDIRYNLTCPGAYLNTAAPATDFPNLLIATNRFIAGGARPSYVSADQEFANDAAAGLGNASAGDSGGSITNYILTSGTGGADLGQDHGCNITDLQAALAGTDTDWDYPEQPRTLLDTTMPNTSGYVTKTVKASGGNFTSLNTAVNDASVKNAVTGIIVQIDAGLTLTENVTLPVHTNPWVIIQTSSGSLPAAGTRVGPGDAATMAKVQTSNTDPVLKTAAGAGHYRFVGLEITTSVSGGQVPFNLINTDGDSTFANMPTDIIVDRCYVHGHATNGARRGIYMQSARTAVIESYFSDFKDASRDDTQAILGSFGAGPFKISNNYLSATAENVLFGGEDSPISYMTPADIQIVDNLFFKSLTWNPSDPSYGGTLYAVKNHIELKHAQRVLIDGNTFQNYWLADQNMAITITPRNQSGGNPWARVTDVTFTNNIFINNTGGGVVIQGDDNYNPSQRTDRILIQNNNFDQVGTASGAILFEIFAGPVYGGPNHVIIDHNFCLDGRQMLLFDYGTTPNFVFTNNCLGLTTFRITSNDTFTMNATLAARAPGARFRNNLIIGTPPGGDPLPTLNYNVADNTAANFVNLAGGDYHLSSSSVGYRAGTEGVTIGSVTI